MGQTGEFWWYWGLRAHLDIDGNGTPIVISDYPGPNDPQDALGYHWVDGNQQPYAVVFAGLCRDHGKPTTVAISHEMLEMLADQSTATVNLIELGDGTGVLVDQEVCDPCEDLFYEGPAGSVLSDFALPAWWFPGYQGQVDLLGRLPGPLRDASGSVASVQTVSFSDPQPSGTTEAERIIEAAAAALRDQAAAAYDSRVHIVERLRARSTGGRVRYAPPAGTASTGRRGPIALERRKQTASAGGSATVVRREDIPIFAQGFPL